MEDTLETPETTEVPETFETEEHDSLFTSDEITKLIAAAVITAAVKLTIDAGVKFVTPKVKKALADRKARKTEEAAQDARLIGVK